MPQAAGRLHGSVKMNLKKVNNNSKVSLKNRKRETLTKTLVVDARVIALTLKVSTTALGADQSLANLAASTILIPSTQRSANSIGVASFVAQTLDFRCANGGASSTDTRGTR